MKVTCLTTSLTALTLSNIDYVSPLHREGKITILVHFNQTLLVVPVKSVLVILSWIFFFFFFVQHVFPLSAARAMVLSQPRLYKVREEGTGGNAAYCSSY